MAPPKGVVRICPACGQKNKAKWEFCVRCGESLSDVTLVNESALAAAAAPAGGAEVVALPGPAIPWVLVIALVILLGGAVLVARRYSILGEYAPDPGIFAGPTLPASLPPAKTAPSPARDLTAEKKLIGAGDAAGALAGLAQAVADAPDDPDARHAYATALWQTGAQQEALTQYGEAVRLSPRTELYRIDLAKALAALGRTAEAIQEYETALAQQPDAPGFLRELAGLYIKLGNHAGAVPHLRRAVELTPGSAVLQQDLASALQRSGDKAGALEAYRKVVELNPKASVSRAQLAELMYAEGRKDEAIEAVRAGIALDANAAGLHRALGSLLERAGRAAEAAAEYREYARLAPNAPDAKSLLDRAATLEKSGPGAA
jgi:tetratricopeptide (TPR) repeat protein